MYIHYNCSLYFVANMESRDQPLPTERNETPDWEEEIVAENKDSARVAIDSDAGGKGGAGEQKKEIKEESGELAKKREEKTKAKKPKAVASQAQAQGVPGSNEYILDGFDFSTGTIWYLSQHLGCWPHNNFAKIWTIPTLNAPLITSIVWL